MRNIFAALVLKRNHPKKYQVSEFIGNKAL